MFKLLRRSTAEYHSIKDHRIVINKVSVMLLLGRRKHLFFLAGENIEKRGFLTATSDQFRLEKFVFLSHIIDSFLSQSIKH